MELIKRTMYAAPGIGLVGRILYTGIAVGLAGFIMSCGNPEEMHPVASYPAVRIGPYEFLISDKAPEGSDIPVVREIHMKALVGNPFPYRVDALDYGADRVRERLRIEPQREIPPCLEIHGFPGSAAVTTKCTKAVVRRADYLLDLAEDAARAPLGFALVPIR